MVLTLTHFFTLCVLIFACSQNVKAKAVDEKDGNKETCFRVRAAFNYKDALYLVDNDEYIEVDKEFKEVGHGKLNHAFLGAPSKITAATVYSNDDYLYFFQGDRFFYYSFGLVIGKHPISSYFPSNLIRDGIDAAGNLDGVTYFFRGCYFTTAVDDEAQYMRKLGLPCDIDAAWGMDGNLHVTKGDKYWVLTKDGVASGYPKRFSELAHVTSNIELCTEKDIFNAFDVQVQEEKKYEEEHGCVILDAAITWEDTVYIFNGRQYVTLDQDGKEKDIHKNLYWGGLPANIDAAVIYDDTAYFFRGGNYFKYGYGLSIGPNSNDMWGEYFEEGIDAAGNHDWKSYFFKGCEVATIVDEEGKTEITNSENFGLPCNVDVAFNGNDALYVVKGDQVWKWKYGTGKADSPKPLSSLITFTSWKVCPR